MTEKETETTSTKEDTSLAFAGEASSSHLEGEEVEFALCSSSEDAPEGGKSPREIVGRAKRALHWGVQSRFRVIYIYIYILEKWFPLQGERGRSF